MNKRCKTDRSIRFRDCIVVASAFRNKYHSSDSPGLRYVAKGYAGSAESTEKCI
jgi:hypothetical protein